MIKNYLIYGGFTLLSSGIGFLITPILSHYLSKSDFGVIGLFMVAVQLFTPVVGLSMNSIISRSYHTRSDIDSLLGSSLVFISMLASFVFFVLLAIPDSALLSIGYTTELLLLALLASFFMINAATLSALLQMDEQAFKWGVATLANTLVLLAVTFFMLLVYDLGYMSRVWGIITAQIVATVLMFVFINKKFHIKYALDFEHFKYFFTIGGPLIFTALSGWAMISVDRLFVEKMLGTDMTGLYVFAITLASPAFIIQLTFTRVWSPRVYKALSKSGFDGLLKETSISYLGYIVVGILFCIVGIDLFRLIIDVKFYPALDLLPWLVLAIVVQGVQGLLVPFMLHLEKSKVMAYGATVGVVINTAANYYFIPDYGLRGAALASIMGHFAISLTYLLCVGSVFFQQDKVKVS